MFKNIKNYKAGFTLVEALVAISILMIAIASPMTLAQKGLSTATLSKDYMIASFLAQDAIEAVKNIRDQIAISSVSGDWLNGTILNDCICKESDNNCNFDNTSLLKFCTIDTTRSWASTGGGSIQLGDINNAKLKISYTDSIPGPRQFLKYDYQGNNGLGGDNISKFTRYINIKKTSNTPGAVGVDEAVINVRVFWDSPQGMQKVDIQDFIYNYSENL